MSNKGKAIIMSIVNKLLRNFSEKKSGIPVVASAILLGVTLALTTCGTPAPAFDGTYKLNNEFKENWNNVTDKAVSYSCLLYTSPSPRD